MDVVDVKQQFLAFYAGRGYKRTTSAPLVIPQLHTAFVMSVGLLQLKAVLTPSANDHCFPPFCMVQRCLRHFDIEQVGSGNRLSFFEMAGAISSGDKEPQEVLSSLIEFLTDIVVLPKDRLVFSTFSGGDFMNAHLPPDLPSGKVLTDLKIPESRVFKCGSATNLFGTAQRDETCGPTVEIFLDCGWQPTCPNPALCMPGCSCQRYVEVGTCVFLRYIKNAEGLVSLPKPYCEAAVGVERLAFVASKLPSIYNLRPLQDVSTELANRALMFRPCTEQPNADAQVCSDHLRAVVFALSEGARPGRGGRPHVLRKLIRRMFARVVFDKDAFADSLPELVNIVAERNSHVVVLRQQQLLDVCDILASERELFKLGILRGTSDVRRYLKEPKR